MKFKKLDRMYYLRIDSGEEIVESIKEFCKKQNIQTGLISGLGSVTMAELGLFELSSKQYHKNEFKGIYEIASLNGNITEMNNDAYLHIHAVLSDKQCNTYGGHLAKAVVGATCEILIVPDQNSIDRFFSNDIGLNLLDI